MGIKAVVSANTWTNLKTATLNYIFRFQQQYLNFVKCFSGEAYFVESAKRFAALGRGRASRDGRGPNKDVYSSSHPTQSKGK